MKSHAIHWSHIGNDESTRTVRSANRLNEVMRLSARAFTALVPALAIVVGSAWLAATPELVIYLQAALWAGGFIFLGLAIDSGKPAALASLATGIALPVLAYLSSQVAVELVIVAATLVAGWLAAAIFRR